MPADEEPLLAALGISSPVMDLAAELHPLQMADEKFKPLWQQAMGSDPHYRLKDDLLYHITAAGDRVVVPDSLVK